MILEAIGLRKKSPNDAAAGAAAGSESNVAKGAGADEASVRLERELAVLLARRPKHHPASVEDVGAVDDEVPFDFGETPEPASRSPNPPNHAMDDAPPDLRPPVEAAGDTHTRWLKTTRRKRRSKALLKAASFAITLVVTAFIVSLVAVMLFGLPAPLKEFGSLGGTNAVAETGPAGLKPAASAVALPNAPGKLDSDVSRFGWLTSPQ